MVNRVFGSETARSFAYDNCQLALDLHHTSALSCLNLIPWICQRVDGFVPRLYGQRMVSIRAVVAYSYKDGGTYRGK